MSFRSSGNLYLPVATAILFALALSILWHSILLEQRWFRDFARLTPFHGVEIERVEVAPDRLSVWGSLIKRRCEKTSIAAYTVRGGKMLIAVFSAAGEPKGTPEDRPESTLSQPFGPWEIISTIADPEFARVYAWHRCPEGVQRNLVFEVPWRAK